jgi:hypothetical protein
MKTILSLAIGLISTFHVFAISFSDTNNGIYLVIAGWRPGFVTNEVLQFDDSLVWCPFCNTRAV